MTASLVRWEPFPECAELPRQREVNFYHGRERRSRPRKPLHWRLRIYTAPEAAALETRTENLSSEGFYCEVPEAIMPGQTIQCVLHLPYHGAPGENAIFLNCQARVIRAETGQAPGSFGIGCRIEQYSVIVQKVPPE